MRNRNKDKIASKEKVNRNRDVSQEK